MEQTNPNAKYPLRLCPFCRKPAVFIGVHDYEGNYHGQLGCEYESAPWSGLSYALHHEGTTDCLLCSNGAEDVMGHMLYDTAEEAADAWNNQTVTYMPDDKPAQSDAEPSDADKISNAKIILNIKGFAPRRKMRLQTLEKAMDISPGYLSRIRKTAKILTIQNTVTSAKILNISINDLIEKDLATNPYQQVSTSDRFCEIPEKEIIPRIITNIKLAAKQQNIKYSTLEETMGVSKGYLSRAIDKPDAKLNTIAVYNAAKILDMTVDDLIVGNTADDTEPAQPAEPQLHQIAIDGPAAAGKTTMAKRLAEKLEYLYIDTGAMYRVIALHMLRQNMSMDSIPAILKTVNFKVQTENDGQHVYLDDEDVTNKIRTQEISRLASDISAQPAVREYLLHQQRQLANAGCVVMEGRDIGSVILPNADIKFYLTADLLVRAKRRFKDELEKGLVNTDPFKLVKDMEQRDYNDSHRATAPLVKTPDAILIDNSNLTIEETEAVMMAIIKLRTKS